MAKQTKARNHQSQTVRLLTACAIGAAIGLVCSILFSLAAAIIIDKSDLPHRSIMPISVAILALSSLIAGFASGLINRRRALVVGAVTSSIIFAVVFLASFFVPDKDAGANIFIKLAASFFPTIIGSIISVNLPRKD